MRKNYKNIYDFVFKIKNIYKNSIYLRSLENKSFNLSYNKLYEFILKFNKYLDNLSIKKKYKIVVIFENCELLTLLFFSIIGSNRIFIPINPSSSCIEYEKIIKQTNPDLIIIERNYFNKFQNKKKIKKIIVNDNLKFIEKIFLLQEKRIANFSKKNVSQILFSSGSTGAPKGVILTHENILENLNGIQKALNVKKKNFFLAITPLYHNNGQFIPTLLCFASGGTTLPVNSLIGFRSLWEIIIKYKINYSSFMATHICYLNNISIKYPKKNFLKAIFCGGAKLNHQDQIFFENKFNTKVYTNYGLTETSSIVSTQTKKNQFPNSVGLSLYNNKIKILSKKKEYKGEIVIKGKNLFKEYLNNNKLTKSKFKNGWFYTGDIGYKNNKGYLFILDRVDNMTIISGENVYPHEVEKHLNQIPGLIFGVVISIPDNFTQNQLVLIYEGKKISSSIIKGMLFKNISRFKVPKYVVNCKDINLKTIPKFPNGKVKRKELQNYCINFFSRVSSNFL